MGRGGDISVRINAYVAVHLLVSVFEMCGSASGFVPTVHGQC